MDLDNYIHRLESQLSHHYTWTTLNITVKSWKTFFRNCITELHFTSFKFFFPYFDENNISFGPKYVQINLFWGNTSLRCGEPVGTGLLGISSSMLYLLLLFICTTQGSFSGTKLFPGKSINLIFHCSVLTLWKEHELIDTVVFSTLKSLRDPRLPLGLQGTTGVFLLELWILVQPLHSSIWYLALQLLLLLKQLSFMNNKTHCRRDELVWGKLEGGRREMLP